MSRLSGPEAFVTLRASGREIHVDLSAHNFASLTSTKLCLFPEAFSCGYSFKITFSSTTQLYHQKLLRYVLSLSFRVFCSFFKFTPKLQLHTCDSFPPDVTCLGCFLTVTLGYGRGIRAASLIFEQTVCNSHKTFVKSKMYKSTFFWLPPVKS